MATISVYVYDLSAMNSSFRTFGIGVYHSSLVVNDNTEYSYALSPNQSTGIQSNPVSRGRIPNLYQKVKIGTISSSYREFTNVVNHFMTLPRWYGLSYSSLHHNCNSFTLELCQAVCDEKQMLNYPHWIHRGQNLISFVIRISLSSILVLSKTYNDQFRPSLDDNDAYPNDESQEVLLGRHPRHI